MYYSCMRILLSNATQVHIIMIKNCYNAIIASLKLWINIVRSRDCMYDAWVCMPIYGNIVLLPEILMLQWTLLLLTGTFVKEWAMFPSVQCDTKVKYNTFIWQL